MTATEARRAFSALLDAVESGDTVTIERAGRPVAKVSPVSRSNGRSLKDVVSLGVDDGFMADVNGIRDLLDGDQTSWPDA